MAKIKISEYPVIDHTLGKIGTDDIRFNVEYFTPVLKFRWLLKKDPIIEFALDKVLQQLHIGSNGGQRWEDIETVFEE